MSETQILTLAAALVATMFGLLTAVLGWIGSKTYAKIEEMGDTLHRIAGDLHEKITVLDRRVTRVETYQQTCPGGGGRQLGG